jgi:hypothetical protein
VTNSTSMSSDPVVSPSVPLVNSSDITGSSQLMGKQAIEIRCARSDNGGKEANPRVEGLYVRGDAQPWRLTARQHEGTELCTRHLARDQDRCIRNAWLVIHILPTMRCERTEVPCVAPYASASIGAKRDVSKVPQAPGPPQMNVEGGEAVPSLLAPVLRPRARRALL